jgi:hypothetical protein
LATENIRIDYDVQKKELEAANKVLKELIKTNKITQKEADELTKKFKNQDKQLSKTNKAFTGLGDQMKSLGNRLQVGGKGLGDMAAGMFKVTGATKKATWGMKAFRVAVAATGIGLLVIALGTLFAVFKKSQAGSDKLSQALGAIGAVVDTVIGRLAIFGSAMADILSGNFSAGWDKLGESVAGFTTEIKGAIEGSNEYEKMLIKLEETEIKVGAAVAKRKREIQELLLATRDGTLSFAEQDKALDVIQKKQVANEAALLDLAQQKLDIAQKDFDNTPIALRGREQELAIATAQAAVDMEISNAKAGQRDTANRELELAGRIAAVEAKRGAEETKRATEKEAQRVKDEAARLKQEIQDAADLKTKRDAISEVAALKLESEGMLEEAELERRVRLLENEELFEEERALIIAQSEANIVAIKEKSAADQQKADDAAKANASANLTGLVDEVGAVAKEGSLIGKGVALTKIGQDTAMAISSLTAQSEANPANAVTFGGAGVLQFITGLVRIGANIASAKSLLTSPTKFEKGGRIGGNLHSNGGTLVEGELDEFVMSRKATAKYGFDFMDKINNLELHDLTVKGNGPNVNIIDTKEIAEQLKDMPQNVINVDSEGFILHQRRGHHIMNQKLQRYST